MANQSIDISDFHWLIEMVQNIDVGLVVLDRQFRVQVWNSFMENHSGMPPHEVKDRVLFEAFPEIPEDWFRHKVDSVFVLKNRAFTIWEQRPHLFKFKNYRPITGTADLMYQNITLIPLGNITGEVSHVCIMVYDVTDVAMNRKGMLQANSQLEHLSRTDRLTELNNRGHWEECLEREFRRFKRTGQDTSLVMFDIDHFKAVNDTYGHQAGDEVIRQVAKTLRDTMRETDIGGRYGGEEFGVILVNTDASSAYFFAERLRKKIGKLTVHHDEQKIEFTISLGISQLHEGLDDYQAWLEESDQALYQSKEGGRNQANIFGAKLK